MVLAQDASPSAVAHIYKTTVPPLTSDCASPDGAFARKDLGKRSHVLQLNAMARHITAAQGWTVLNMEPLVAFFP